MISPKTELNVGFSSLSRLISSIHSELQHLSNFDDVLAVILFRIDGQVLKAEYQISTSNNLLIVVSWVKSIITKTMEELKSGSKSVKYVKDIKGKSSVPVYFYRSGKSSILVTILTDKVNTGFMEIEMSRTAKRLGWIIDKKLAIEE
ncbi:MAG: hypothetical protein ACTSR2_11100 [Candidatus Hodarchaeales archaeon]